jgi:hypothetical protein
MKIRFDILFNLKYKYNFDVFSYIGIPENNRKLTLELQFTIYFPEYQCRKITVNLCIRSSLLYKHRLPINGLLIYIVKTYIIFIISLNNKYNYLKIFTKNY